MPNNLESANLELDNFSISDTIGMGSGDATLINDLMSPETSTDNPDDIKQIVDEVPNDDITKTPAVPKGKVVTPPDSPTDPDKALTDFLGNAEEEEEDDDSAGNVIAKGKTNVKPKEVVEDDDDDYAQPVSKFTALSNDLTKLGVFSELEEGEEPISTPEQFLEKFNVEKQKGSIQMVNNFIGQFGEDYQKAFDAIFVKGANPKEYFGVYNQVVDFADMDLSVEANQEQVLRQALTNQGFDSEDVTSEIERLRNYGDLESVATKHHKVLVKQEATKLQEIEQQAAATLQQKTAVRNQYISNVQSILQEKVKAKEFDGIPLSPKLAGELQDFLLVDKWKTNSGETLSDFDRTILEMKRPENHATKVKVALLLKLLETDPTLSTIQRTGVTKKTDALFGEVARHVTKDKTVPNKSTPSKSWFS